MSRLSPLNRALVLILAPLSVIWFAAGVRTQIEGGGLALIGLTLESAESYPVVNGTFSAIYSWDPLDQAGLRAGDRLVRVGEEDLHGVGNAGFVGRLEERPGVPIRGRRDTQDVYALPLGPGG